MEAATASRALSGNAGRLDQEAAGAFVGDLFTEHARMVLGLCRLLLRDPVDAEDAAQQVFLSAHQAVLRGSSPRDPPAWLAAITRNECRARVRARMREPLSLPDLPSDLPDPLVSAIRAADLEAAWAALGALPRRQRRALVLRELGGLSYHELGRVLGVSHSAVESLLFRARRQLRSLVAGVNAAVAPLALRDQLAQAIPGFDPTSAGVAARLVAVPVAWKLGGAAVGVGVVATGASGLHPRVSHVAAQRPRQVELRVARPPGHPARPVQQHAVVQPRPVHERRGRPEAEGHRRGGHDDAGPRVQTTAEGSGSSDPDPAEPSHEGPGEGTAVATATVTTSDDHSVSSSSGHDGGSSGSDSGSGHSGPG